MRKNTRQFGITRMILLVLLMLCIITQICISVRIWKASEWLHQEKAIKIEEPYISAPDTALNKREQFYKAQYFLWLVNEDYRIVPPAACEMEESYDDWNLYESVIKLYREEYMEVD